MGTVRYFVYKKEILGTPQTPRKGHPPLTNPHGYRAVVIYKRDFGDTPNPAQGASASYESPWVPCGILFIKKRFWGHPKPRAKGIRPLRIPGSCSCAVVRFASYLEYEFAIDVQSFQNW